VLSNFAGLGSACPGFMKTRYSASAVSTRTARTTERDPHVANTGPFGSRAASPGFVLAQALPPTAFAWLPMSGNSGRRRRRPPRSRGCLCGNAVASADRRRHCFNRRSRRPLRSSGRSSSSSKGAVSIRQCGLPAILVMQKPAHPRSVATRTCAKPVRAAYPSHAFERSRDSSNRTARRGSARAPPRSLEQKCRLLAGRDRASSAVRSASSSAD
jgi:hypothetical protein